jgi:hypothetical protein
VPGVQNVCGTNCGFGDREVRTGSLGFSSAGSRSFVAMRKEKI